MRRPGVEPVTCWSQVQRPNCCGIQDLSPQDFLLQGAKTGLFAQPAKSLHRKWNTQKRKFHRLFVPMELLLPWIFCFLELLLWKKELLRDPIPQCLLQAYKADLCGKKTASTVSLIYSRHDGILHSVLFWSLSESFWVINQVQENHHHQVYFMQLGPYHSIYIKTQNTEKPYKNIS